MKTETKRRLMLWGAGIVLAALFFGPSIRGIVQRVMFMRHAPTPVKPSPMKPTAPESGTQTTAAKPDTAPNFDAILGKWQGTGPVAPNVCTLKVELRKKADDATHFAGFPVLSCFPMMPTLPGQVGPTTQQAILARISPLSGVLTGTAVNGSLQFTVDRVIGKTTEGCALTAFTITPFGDDQISAEWQEGDCHGGQMLLRKDGR